MEPIKMTVAFDEDSNECLFVEGRRWSEKYEGTVYSVDLHTAANGRPIQLDRVLVDRPTHHSEKDGCGVYDDWPDTLDEAKAWGGAAVSAS